MLALAATHSHAAMRIAGIAFIVIGAFTFTFRRAMAARNPQGAQFWMRTFGPIASAAYVVFGLVLILLS